MRSLFLLITVSLSYTTLFAQSNVQVSYTPLSVIIPSDNLPKQVKCMRANNNLDVIAFKGKYYIAFRTAPTHFASKKTKVYVISTTDFQTYTFENEIHLGSDIREPRFLNINGRLLLYCFQGGKKMYAFEPKHLWVSERFGTNEWSLEKVEHLDGYVPWRVKMHNGIAYMSAYYGVGLYQANHKGDLRLFTSDNGINWQPLSTTPQVEDAGAEEGEFVFDDEGNLWATVRLEGAGAHIAYADKDSLDKWHLTKLKDKYDSALLFNHKNEMYLVSRRNLDGDFDKTGKRMPYALQQKINLIKYSLTPKVTALFKLNKSTKTMEHILDFPSTGDTAFPGLAKKTDSSYVLLNYSSDIKGKRKTWIRGQFGRTYIYMTELNFEEKNYQSNTQK